jgi:hypothetical protein
LVLVLGALETCGVRGAYERCLVLVLSACVMCQGADLVAVPSARAIQPGLRRFPARVGRVSAHSAGDRLR